MAPLGFLIWLAMQMGYVMQLLNFVLGERLEIQQSSIISAVNITIAIISFFSFLSGMYFISFSKEKVEDEMVARTRMDSFQFAAIMQFIFMSSGFLSILFFYEPEESGYLLFFIASIFLFWIFFIGRFNYVLHIRLKG
jgi:hypothetical protein